MHTPVAVSVKPYLVLIQQEHGKTNQSLFAQITGKAVIECSSSTSFILCSFIYLLHHLQSSSSFISSAITTNLFQLTENILNKRKG